MDISIIIVSFNTCNLLRDCLRSIYKNTKDINFEIIIVDNLSTDNSQEENCKEFPNVVWVNANANLGFGRANNLGAKYAKGDYLFFLNPDTILLNNAPKIFYDYFINCNDKKLGAIGGWLLDTDLKLNNSFGFFPSPKNELKYIVSTFCKSSKFDTGICRNVDFISGADLCISRQLFLSLNGFDPNIFMYYEETDLQYRMHKLGYIRRIVPNAKIIHLEGGSFANKGLSYNRFVMSQTSYNYYLKKHFKGITYFFYKMCLVLFRLVIFFTTNWGFPEKMRAYRLVFK